jgi:hypothetical protein
MNETAITIELSSLLALLFAAINLIVLGPIAWILRNIAITMRKLETAHDALKDRVFLEFVSKSDYTRDMQEIKTVLQEILLTVGKSQRRGK